MKAIVYHEYGSHEVLKYEDVDKPTPKDNEVLIKVMAVSINYADNALLAGEPFLVRLGTGLKKPKNHTLGADIAGRVEAVGKDVSQFRAGEDVFGDLSGCGFGGLAEYAAVPEDVLALKPGNISFEEAAAVPMAAVTALQGFRAGGQIQPGQSVLINGASGGVGTFALQIAKSYGAEVTAVCSTSKMEMVRSIGADHVIDYTKENFTRSGVQYDVIVGVNGHHPLGDYKRALKDDGVYICIGGTMGQIFESMLLGPIMSIGSRKKLINMGAAKPDQKDLATIKDMIEAGKIVPLVDETYPLADAAEAFRRFRKGKKKGKIVIKVEQS